VESFIIPNLGKKQQKDQGASESMKHLWGPLLCRGLAVRIVVGGVHGEDQIFSKGSKPDLIGYTANRQLREKKVFGRQFEEKSVLTGYWKDGAGGEEKGRNV